MANHVSYQTEYAANYVELQVSKGKPVPKTVRIAARLYGVSFASVAMKVSRRKRGIARRHVKI